MRISLNWFMIFSLFFLPTSYAFSQALIQPHEYAFNQALTPPNEPVDNSFYVCYEKRRVRSIICPLFFTYRKFRYLGCVILRKPCEEVCLKPKPIVVERQSCGGVCLNQTLIVVEHLKPFGWFNNYPQALNAFYRCAYT
jgi:hypothetical protein